MSFNQNEIKILFLILEMVFHVAEKVAEAAKQAAAAAKVEAILKMPLWQHSSRCLLVVGVLLWGSAYLSHLLHREADRVEAGEV